MNYLKQIYFAFTSQDKSFFLLHSKTSKQICLIFYYLNLLYAVN